MTLRELLNRLDLLDGPRRVLVVEDHLPVMLRLKEFLAEAGHDVTAVVGFESHLLSSKWCVLGEDDARMLVGDDASGTPFDPRTVQVAFLDHYFLSRTHRGATFVPELLRHGSPKILGMSSDPAANRAMVEAGATLAIKKSELVRLLG